MIVLSIINFLLTPLLLPLTSSCPACFKNFILNLVLIFKIVYFINIILIINLEFLLPPPYSFVIYLCPLRLHPHLFHTQSLYCEFIEP